MDTLYIWFWPTLTQDERCKTKGRSSCSSNASIIKTSEGALLATLINWPSPSRAQCVRAYACVRVHALLIAPVCMLSVTHHVCMCMLFCNAPVCMLSVTHHVCMCMLLCNAPVAADAVGAELPAAGAPAPLLPAAFFNSMRQGRQIRSHPHLSSG
jgi:hypothetical protein